MKTETGLFSAGFILGACATLDGFGGGFAAGIAGLTTALLIACLAQEYRRR